MLLQHLTTPAKNKILQLLARVGEPLCLREIVSLTGVGIRSAQLALKSLRTAKIVEIKRERNLCLYQIKDSDTLKDYKLILELQCERDIRSRSRTISNRTRGLLPKIQELNDFGLLVQSRVQKGE